MEKMKEEIESFQIALHEIHFNEVNLKVFSLMRLNDLMSSGFLLESFSLIAKQE